LKALRVDLRLLGGFFDLEQKTRRLEELEVASQAPDFWSSPEKAREVLQQRSQCERSVNSYREVEKLYNDSRAALELAEESKDDEFLKEAEKTHNELMVALEKQEFYCKMSGEFDHHSAIIEINSGAGGTEAQDWSNMLLRVYTRWAERKGFTVEMADLQQGDVAGIKGATIMIEGEYAYGHLRSEQGVHRLVRISPFDSNARRHTSFASITVTPNFGENVPVDVNEADLKIDTFKSGGAGGQHVNKTESAVRITHAPTGIIVACQTERSQHKNRAMAMSILKSKLYELQKEQQADKLDGIRGERKKIEWGSQIRSYVMQPYQMVKDLRTGFETSNISGVMDGEIDPIIESFLMSDANERASANISDIE